MQIIFEADLNKMTEELQELSPERSQGTERKNLPQG